MEDNLKTLEYVNVPEDLKTLDNAQLNTLANEIRFFLLDNISKTGGHLASNLGVVEMTLALHRVFDFSVDRLIWDVGHQSYVHKIVTGRKGRFNNLRKTGGMSGFPKRSESIYDSFNTGHSSTSISAAVGMARARDLSEEKYKVVAVIGDGSITGGIALEALNEGARANTDFIVVLNDNQMSIDKNVGGLSRYFRKLRIYPLYRKTAYYTEHFLKNIPIGGSFLTRMVKRIKKSVTRLLIRDNLFENLGYKYVGPIDGHNIQLMERVFSESKMVNQPLLIHVITNKGKGYKMAEKNPEIFHGISSFNPETGDPTKIASHSYSAAFGAEMMKIADSNNRVVAVIAAMKAGTGLNEFAEVFSHRFFDVGIAEQHAVTMAAGMAAQGLIPVVAVYSSFLQRAYDQLLHDTALQKLHVIFAIDRAGLVGEDGETHQGLYDLAYLNHIPDMMILAPSDYNELRSMLNYAVNECEGPVALRYPRGGAEREYQHDNFTPGIGEVISEGDDVTVCTIGNMLDTGMRAADLLRTSGIKCEVINIRSLKPFDAVLLCRSARKTGRVITVEDGIEKGGLADSCRAALLSDGYSGGFISAAFPDKPIEHGDIKSIKERYRMDPSSIAKRIVEKWGADFAERKT